MRVWICFVVFMALCVSSALAQSVLRVPEDYPTIQAAADAAIAGDTIRVGPGVYCGAAVTKKLRIVGESEPTITTCAAPRDTMGPTGFLLDGRTEGVDPSGTTIQHFNFSGLHSAVFAYAAHNVTFEYNTVQCAGVNCGAVRGLEGSSYWTVSHNKITSDDNPTDPAHRNYGTVILNNAGSGWTVTHNTITGTGVTGGIYFLKNLTFLPNERSTNNYAAFNYIEGASDWYGIGVTGQDGAVITNNKIFVPTSAGAIGQCRAWGIEVSNANILTSINSVIVNNDTMNTAIGIIVLLDKTKGPGNSAGMVLRGNFGTLSLNQPWQPCNAGDITHVVSSRAISTMIVCDAFGVCTEGK